MTAEVTRGEAVGLPSFIGPRPTDMGKLIHVNAGHALSLRTTT